MKKTYKVDVDCANCAAKMETAVKETTGVKDASLSFMTLKLKVEFEDGADVDAVMKQARANCKKVEDDCEIFL
ncbi:MAG: cation transporter [Lachnospiraceae bacterium]|nr:cation transporter [Lachnospiraceae bacterium]